LREQRCRNDQVNIAEKPCPLREFDDSGDKGQEKCDDQPTIDEIAQPAFACHLYPAWNAMGSN
jgi:hypothetical protein